MLVAECEAASVDLRCHTRITGVTKDTHFRIATTAGTFTAESLVLATGSLSIPKMGATGFAHDLAMQFGLPLTEIRPALVPLTFGDTMLELMRPLSGLALESVAKAGKAAFREAMLFTHRGLSGPAILQASSYWREGEMLTLDLVPDRDATAVLLAGKRARPKAEAKTILGDLLPARLAAAMAAQHLPPRTIGEIGDGDLRKLGAMLKAWALKPSGTEGYAKAEVTLGGVDTEALSSQTMMAKDVPGLFFIGEAVDVTGWLGGYNFQWAWSSGWAAGEAA
jgi:predicted Rossmann fold flavoprotein